MYGTVLWLVLGAAAIMLEVTARVHQRPEEQLRALGALLASRPLGRVALGAGWVFIGIHLFARYGLSPH